MRKILITGGPTNEIIDEVMKITNMSTGGFSKKLAEQFCKSGYEVHLIMNKGINVNDLSSRIIVIPVETTEEMMAAIKDESEKNKFDVMIHAAAVGDYKTDFTFLMSDLAEELFKLKDTFKSSDDVLNVLMNPESRLDNSSKISSYQNDLSVKLTLTPKIISNLRNWMKDTLLIGCKLLENVPKDELFQVGHKLCVKNQMDFIMANDLADLRKGNMSRYIIDKEGFTGYIMNEPEEIFDFIDDVLNKRRKISNQ